MVTAHHAALLGATPSRCRGGVPDEGSVAPPATGGATACSSGLDGPLGEHGGDRGIYGAGRAVMRARPGPPPTDGSPSSV